MMLSIVFSTILARYRSLPEPRLLKSGFGQRSFSSELGGISLPK